MPEQHASVTIHAPVEQVYALFTHFDDFPKFMHFVKEVTYYDEQRSHWVVHVLNDHEWDAVNEDWIPNKQIGWRSTRGLQNTGKVKFRAISPQQTIVDVYLHYVPPTGPLGVLGDSLGGNTYFARILQEDLNHFAAMVEQAPAGALDPMSSHYLFHKESAVTRGETTERQKAMMASDPRMSSEALAERNSRVEQEAAARREAQQSREQELLQRREQRRKAEQEQRKLMEREQARRLQEQRERAVALAQAAVQYDPHPIHDTIGGRNASLDRTAFGDQDSRRPRHPKHEEDPMTARHPNFLEKSKVTVRLDEEEVKQESPWRSSIRGRLSENKQDSEQKE